MGIFGKILKTGFDVLTLPIDAAKDVVTMGGAVTGEESAIVKKGKRLSKDLEEVRKEVDKL